MRSISVTLRPRRCPCCYQGLVWLAGSGPDSCLFSTLTVLGRYVDLELLMRCTLVSSDQNSAVILCCEVSFVLFQAVVEKWHTDRGRVSRS